MTKIAILGAEGAGFAQQVITDSLSNESLPVLDPLTAAVYSLHEQASE
ncbi:hypothetical protein [Deinococcus alpinitundrae]|nr:hypothetical protein [Deinococcus alpinitundrae]